MIIEIAAPWLANPWYPVNSKLGLIRNGKMISVK
jgi:hypothetical protein